MRVPILPRSAGSQLPWRSSWPILRSCAGRPRASPDSYSPIASFQRIIVPLFLQHRFVSRAKELLLLSVPLSVSAAQSFAVSAAAFQARESRDRGAQGEQCTATPLRSVAVRLSDGRSLYVELRAVASGADRILALGTPVLVRQGSDVSPAITSKGTVAGALIGPDGIATLVPSPTGAQELVAPHVHYSAGIWHVLWMEVMIRDSTRALQTGRVMYAKFDGKKWSTAQSVSSRRTFFLRETSPTHVAVLPRGFGLVKRLHPDSGSGVLVLVNENGRWRETVIPIATPALYATLAGWRDQLFVATVGSLSDGNSALIVTRSSDGGTTWEGTTVVARGTVFEPRLLPGSRELALAWLGADENLNPRGAWMSFAGNSSGTAWTTPAILPDGEDVRSMTSALGAADRLFVLQFSGPRPPIARTIVSVENRSTSVLRRDTLEGETPIAISPPSILQNDLQALWASAESTSDGWKPKLSLQRFRISCEK
jgi:hypothetical protein